MLYYDEDDNEVRTPVCRFMDWAPVMLTRFVVRYWVDNDKLRLVQYFERAYRDLEEAAAGWGSGYGSLPGIMSLSVKNCVQRKREDAALKIFKDLDCAVLLRSDSDCLEDHWLVFPKLLASPVPPDVKKFLLTVPKERLKDPWGLQMTGNPDCPYTMVYLPPLDRLRSVFGLF